MEFDINKNSYCLTIDDNRYNFLCERFKKVGIEAPKKFKGFVAKGCMHYVRSNTYGQLSIVELARQLDLPYVILFEDDAFPRNDIVDECKRIEHSVKNIQCDVLYLGRNGDAALWNYEIENLHSNSLEFKNQMSNPIKIDDNICSIEKNVFGNHAYVVFKCGYDKFIYTMLELMMTKQMCYADIFLSGSRHLDVKHLVSPLFIQYDMKQNKITRMTDMVNCRGYGLIETLEEFNDERYKI